MEKDADQKPCGIKLLEINRMLDLSPVLKVCRFIYEEVEGYRLRSGIYTFVFKTEDIRYINTCFRHLSPKLRERITEIEWRVRPRTTIDPSLTRSYKDGMNLLPNLTTIVVRHHRGPYEPEPDKDALEKEIDPVRKTHPSSLQLKWKLLTPADPARYVSQHFGGSGTHCRQVQSAPR